MVIRRWTIAVALFAAGVAPVRAQEASARATIDSSAYLIGDAIRVHLRITHPKGATFRSAFGDSAGGFVLLGRTPLNPDGETSTAGEIVVAKYDSGEAVLPPLQFLYTLVGDSTLRTVETNELRITLRTVPVDTTQDIKDLKPPIGIPLEWWEILLAVAAAVALIGILYAAYRWWKKRKRTAAGTQPPAPARPAHVIAFEELGFLEEKKLWQQGLIKPFYTEVTEILRRYLENRYSVMALERTSDEIMEDLRRLRMPPDLTTKAEGLLRRADLVKFAKHQPAIPEHEESLAVAYDFVERTKITPEPAVAEEKP